MKVIHKHSSYAQGTVTMNAVEKSAMMLTIPHYKRIETTLNKAQGHMLNKGLKIN